MLYDMASKPSASKPSALKKLVKDMVKNPSKASARTLDVLARPTEDPRMVDTDLQLALYVQFSHADSDNVWGRLPQPARDKLLKHLPTHKALTDAVTSKNRADKWRVLITKRDGLKKVITKHRLSAGWDYKAKVGPDGKALRCPKDPRRTLKEFRAPTPAELAEFSAAAQNHFEKANIEIADASAKLEKVEAALLASEKGDKDWVKAVKTIRNLVFTCPQRMGAYASRKARLEAVQKCRILDAQKVKWRQAIAASVKPKAPIACSPVDSILAEMDKLRGPFVDPQSKTDVASDHESDVASDVASDCGSDDGGDFSDDGEIYPDGESTTTDNLAHRPYVSAVPVAPPPPVKEQPKPSDSRPVQLFRGNQVALH